jgi:rubrerythrin
MKVMTERNLKDAYGGESMAHMRYLIFANVAEAEGFPNVARLFRSIAFAEQAHATNHYRTLGSVKRTAANLQTAIEGETFEVEEMYPAYKAVAQLQGEKGAQRSADWALSAEKIHASLYQKAKEAVEGGKDIALGDIYICQVCGHTVVGSAPDVCLICGAKHEKFQKF